MGDEVTQGAGDQGVSGAGESGSVAPAGSQNDWTAHIPQEYATEKFWEPLKGKGFGDVLKTYAEGPSACRARRMRHRTARKS